MKFWKSVLSCCLLLIGGNAFTLLPPRSSIGSVRSTAASPLYTTSEEQAKQDDEIERLQSMAAKLRAEAMALEAERAKELSAAAERAFAKFDKNEDGAVSIQELKAGLERELKTELPEKRVQQLLKDFDTSGDGALQLEEFVTMDKFRNRLEALAREEKRIAVEAEKAAQMEAEVAKLLEQQVALINDREPTGTEKILSTLPYLFPLMDGLQFGRFLVIENADNPLVAIVAVLFALYKSIPFGGFIAFFALNILSSNPSINRLIRFNMQQAIFLDVFLFFPGLIAALWTLIFSSIEGVSISPMVTEVGSDAVFFTLLAAIGYASVSSLLGQTPDKIPLIGKLVSDRMIPTGDALLEDANQIIKQAREEAKKAKEAERKKEDKDDS